MNAPTRGRPIAIPVVAAAGDAGAAAVPPADGRIRLQALPPLAVYVHLPWCLRKCPYCDFNSHELRGAAGTSEADREALFDSMLDALRADLEASLPDIWGRRVSSVFIGGGTPSLLSPAAIGRLLDDLRARLPLNPGAEITMEANPGTFERERFRGYRAAGVTRLSIGVQSFDDAALASLGRVHDAAQARAAVEEAAAAFDTFNLDLMYALPGQDLPALRRDLAQALAFAPPHLSVYHLTLEPNTRFAVQPPPDLPDDDLAGAMMDTIVEATAAAGLHRYEVSAYARPGHACAHNLNYWRFGDYLGLGPGAHGKLSFPDRIVRTVRWREPARYIDESRAGRPESQRREVTPAELPFEFMLNVLRLREGVPRTMFAERCGLSPAVLEPALREAHRLGLLEADPLLFKPSERGYDLLNDLVERFLPDAPAPASA